MKNDTLKTDWESDRITALALAESIIDSMRRFSDGVDQAGRECVDYSYVLGQIDRVRTQIYTLANHALRMRYGPRRKEEA